TFMRITNPSDGRCTETYTGYQFPIGQDGWALTGSFESFNGHRGYGPRVIFGWIAEWRRAVTNTDEGPPTILVRGF
ncbi:MAG TPA: hypothetical protein VFV02_12400, partial [Acidimicrobiales bacterium]|nr:hypothetical protein [Acidimicrobiales bacterium]